MKKKLIIIIIAIILFSGFVTIVIHFSEQQKPKATKIYWFIPDGFRADPYEFKLFEWAKEGKLPNIKKMMDLGAYGYSIPDFPSHTPTNFASLLTGSHPVIHGIADGQMHIEGYPLDKPSVKGFSSVSKKVAPIWNVLENAGKKVLLLNIPGSTPPEIKNGIVIRGRWSGWGADTQALVFESKEKLSEMKNVGRGFRLFFLGDPLTKFADETVAKNWKNIPSSYTPALETEMNAYGLTTYAYIFDSTNDGKKNYDKIIFSIDKTNSIATLKQGEWSDWIPIKLNWQGSDFDSDLKINIIKLDENGIYRVRLLYNNINKFLVSPPEVAEETTKAIGPMVDFVDNWPQQLIYELEDKKTFTDEANMSFDWHKRAVSFFLNKYKPDVFIQDIYTPNQILESRWWMGDIDKNRVGYSVEKADKAWEYILEGYKKIDDILGEAIKNSDKNTLIVLSSDHGIAPLNRQVKFNNLFAKQGWLKFKINPDNGEPIIDWNNSKVIYLKMAHIYINPNGLGGNWKRGSGKEYEKLRDQVINLLSSLQDEDGIKPVAKIIKWENVEKDLNLPPDRVGDLVLEAKTGYQWSEEMDNDYTIFVTPLTTGYKQATDPTEPVMWTPFVIMGPGVKKGYQLNNPISHVDQMPTILNLLNIEIPNYVQGKVLTEILKK